MAIPGFDKKFDKNFIAPYFPLPAPRSPLRAYRSPDTSMPLAQLFHNTNDKVS